MRLEETFRDAFVNEMNFLLLGEMEKISAKKKKQQQKTFRSIFKIFEGPLTEAVGYGALLTKGLHMLASAGAFGKALERAALSPTASRLGTLGMGLGATWLGAKGAAEFYRKLREGHKK